MSTRPPFAPDLLATHPLPLVNLNDHVAPADERVAPLDGLASPVMFGHRRLDDVVVSGESP